MWILGNNLFVLWLIMCSITSGFHVMFLSYYVQKKKDYMYMQCPFLKLIMYKFIRLDNIFVYFDQVFTNTTVFYIVYINISTYVYEIMIPEDIFFILK